MFVYSVQNFHIIDFFNFFDNFCFEIMPQQNPIIFSMFIILFCLDIGSMYFSTSVAKRLFFSTYFLIIFLIFLIYWLLPDFSIYNIFLLKLNGFFLIFLYIFRSLREDYKFYNHIF